mmetsp:Transcript_12721/g.30053  ORF Transcript_12721/g.30053 Transcript_12721/m.30053 type:complete len:86 (+) Transcript_12721:683-940(+)
MAVGGGGSHQAQHLQQANEGQQPHEWQQLLPPASPHGAGCAGSLAPEPGRQGASGAKARLAPARQGRPGWDGKLARAARSQSATA